MEPIQHYLNFIKRIHFKYWHKYTKDQIKLFARLQRLKQTASLFYAENLLKRYLRHFIKNVLLPKRKLNEEVHQFYEYSLQKRVLKLLLSVAAQQIDLRYRYEQFVQRRHNFLTLTILKQLLLTYRQRAFISQLEKLRARANIRNQFEAFSQLWLKFRMLGDRYVELMRIKQVQLIGETFPILFSNAQIKIAIREENERFSEEKQKALQYFKAQGHKRAVRSMVDILLAELNRHDNAFVQKQLEDAKMQIELELRNNRQKYFQAWTHYDRETLAYEPFKIEQPQHISTKYTPQYQQYTQPPINYIFDPYKATTTNVRARPAPIGPNVSGNVFNQQLYVTSRQKPKLYARQPDFLQPIQSQAIQQESQKQTKDNQKIIQLQIEEYKDIEQQLNIKIKQVQGIERQISGYDLVGPERYTNQIRAINDEQQIKLLKEQIEALITKRNALRLILREYKEQYQ